MPVKAQDSGVNNQAGEEVLGQAGEPPITVFDISDMETVILDGRTLPVVLLRALAVEGINRLVIESDDASREEIELRREGAATHFIRHPRSGRGTDQAPVTSEYRAELVSPNGQAREWVNRGEERERELKLLGWEEKGRTRPRPRPPQPISNPDPDRTEV